MTGTQRVIAWLRDGNWHCASEALNGIFPEGPMYTFSQRASDVNAKERGRISTRECQRHDHNLYEYLDTYATRPQQLALVG